MNIATLTIEMAANIARLQQDMERARGVVERNAKAMQQAAEAVGNAIGWIAAGFSLSKFISETAGAQDQQVQLAAVLKSTGEAAGWSIGKLNDMAATLADKSKFSAGAIGEAQTRLLSYTGVAGKEFPRAMQNVIDMAQRMGTDVKSAAETVGRALDVPSQGLTALSKQGFRFTEEQKEMVEQLEETGKVGEAQAVIFEAMETSYAGAAEAARHTLGGALVKLQDNINDLMTGGDGSVNGLSAMVEMLAASVRDADDIIKAMGDDASTTSGQMGALQVVQEALATIFETVAALGANVMYVLQGVGREIGGLAAQAAAAATLDFAAVAAIRQEMVSDGEAARKEIDATTARILGARVAAKQARADAEENAKTADREVQGQANNFEKLKKAREDAAAAAKKAAAAEAAAAKQLAEKYQSLIQSIEEKTQAQQFEIAGGEKLKEADKLRIKFQLDLLGSLKNLTTAERARITQGLDGLRSLETENEARKEALKQMEEEHKYRQDLWTDRAKTIEAMDASNLSLREEIELIGLTAQQQVRVLQQRGETVMLIKEATLAELQRASAITGTMTREQIALAAEIEQLKERNELLGNKSLREAVAESDKKLADELANNIKSYDDIFRTGFADMVNRGEDGIKAFGKSLKTTVMTSIADAIYKALAQKFVVNLVGSVLGMGAAGAASAASGAGALGMVGNAASLAGAGASAFGVGASYGATSLFANGLTGTLAAGGQMIGAGSIMSGIGTIAGALGPIALGVGAVMALVKSLDDSGTMHTGALSQYSAAGGVANSTTHGAFGMGFGGVDYSAETEKFTGAMAQSIVQMLDSTAATFGKAAGYKAATAFADDTSKDGAWGGLLISKLEETIVNWDPARTSKWAPREFADGAAGKEQYLAAVAADVRAALESIGLPVWATGMLDKLGQGASLEQLAGAVDQINAAKAAFAGFAQYMPTFAGMADSALATLVTASGGVAALAGNMSAFVEGFYTDAEKLAVNTENVRAALAAVGFEMPKTRDEFRALVEQQLALGDSGAKGAAALLGVADAFARVTPAADDAASAAETVGDALTRLSSSAVRTTADIAAGILSLKATATSLQVDLLKATGDDVGAAFVKRLLDTKDLSAAEIAQYDYIESLRAMIATTNAATAAAASLTTTNKGIQDQIDLLTGKETDRSIALRNASDETTKALLKQLYAQQDLKEAVDIAPIVDSAAQSLGSLGSALSRFGEGLDLRADFFKESTGVVIAKNPKLSGSIYDPLRDLYKEVGLSQAILQHAELIKIIKSNAQSTYDVTEFAANQLTAGLNSYEMFFTDLGKFGVALSESLSQSANTVVGQNLNLAAIAKYFAGIAQEIGAIESALSDLAGFSGGSVNVNAFGASIAAGASAISTALSASLLAKIPDAIKADPALAGVSAEILGVIGGVKKDDVQGLNDSFLLISSALTRGELSGAQYTVAIDYLTEAFKGAAEAAAASAETIEQAYGRLRNPAKTNEGIAQERISLEDRLRSLTSTTVQMRAFELAALDESNRALQVRIYGLEDEHAALETLKKNTDDAYAGLQRAVDGQKKTIGTQLTAAQSLATEVGSIFDTLKGAVKDLYGSVDNVAKQSAAQARSFISSVLIGAQATGSLPDGDALKNAIQAATSGINAGQYASSADLDYERLVLANQLSGLKDIAGDQLTEAERQIKLLRDQLDALDEVLTNARQQIDVMRGIDVSVLSVADAVNAMSVSLSAELQALGGALSASAAAKSAAMQPYSVNDTGAERSAKVEAQTGVKIGAADSAMVAAAKALYQSINGGASTAEFNAAAAGVGGNIGAALGWNGSREDAERLRTQYSFAVGTNYVPRDMVAQIHEGEAIIPKAYNPAVGGAGGNAEVVAELRALRAEVAQLRAAANDGTNAARITADVLLSVKNGNGLNMVPAPTF